ncbi:MAG: hypothetical protein ACMXYG_00400 [Candidatus Woesearchaeota archaeon]
MLGHNKGIVYAGSAIVFIMVFLFFAVSVYENKEIAKQSVEINSLSNRIINLQDSINFAIKQIFYINKNIILEFNTITNPEYINIMTIKTTLSEEGPTNEKFNNELLSFQNNFTYFFPESDMNLTEIINNPIIARSEGIVINKTSYDLITSSSETLQLYYNYSGKTKEGLIGIDIYIVTTEPVRHISFAHNNTPLQSYIEHNNIRLNLSINDINYPEFFINPEIIEDSIQIGFLYNHEYIIEVNNSDNTSTYLNISLDSEVINITSLIGTHNITAKISTNSSSIYQQWVIPYNTYNISLPGHYARSSSIIRFI